MKELTIIGKSPTRVDSLEKVTGRAKYTADFMVPGMLYAKVLRSPYAHAKIKRIDTSRAATFPGVRGIVTPEDAPEKRFGFFKLDRQILPRDGLVRFVGEPVAIVVADIPEIAEEALDLIDIDYEELPAVFDLDEAMQKDPPAVIHPGLFNYARLEYFPLKMDSNLPNVGSIYEIRKGDVDKGFKEADLIVENRFSFDTLQHCPMEPHIADAWLDGDGTLTIRHATQGIFVDLNFIRDVYGLPPSKVRVLSPYVGGGFGNKWESIPALLAALPALKFKSQKPIRLEYTREEVFVSSGQRPRLVYYIKDGVKRDGTLVAREVRILVDSGAYSAGGVPILARTCQNAIIPLYKVPNFRSISYTVYTNNPPTCMMRGVAGPEFLWGVEQQTDIIAEKLGLDPLEMRRRNLVGDGDVSLLGEVLHYVYPKECMDKAAESMAWGKKPKSEGAWKKGKGLSIGTWAGASGWPSAAAVKVLPDGSIEVRHGEDEMGQGLNTVVAQIAAEEFGVSLDRVKVVRGDTIFSPVGHASIGSRSTFYTGNAVVRACQDAKQQLFRLAAAKLGVHPADLETKEGVVYYKAWPKRSIRISDLFSLDGHITELGEILGKGEYRFYKPPSDLETGQCERIAPTYSYLAHAVEVGVNVETGEVKVLKFGAAFDIGQPIHAKMAEAQVEGGMGMGIGTTIYEHLVLENGVVINPTFADYKLPAAAEVPSGENVKVQAVESIHPDGPYGAKSGFGELCLVPFAAAVGNAVYNATGVRITEAPITRERMLGALKQAQKK